ncbi:MAG TPA: hypothetical protein VIH76_06290 [Candidatus Acidoferrales bacterium]
MPDDPIIFKLASADSNARESAAAEIFAKGRALAEPILAVWLQDPPLRANFNDGKPQMTVGVAVLSETFARIRAANGNPSLADVPPDQDAIEFELRFAGGIQLDILTTNTPGGTGAIARFLDKFGEGIQQVELDVKSVDKAMEILRTHFNLAPLYPATRAGADRTRVNFFLASRPDGRKVLIELVEK